MREAVIVSYARTGLAKSIRGGFNATHGTVMAGTAIQTAVERAGIDPGRVEDVTLGVGFPEGATGHNIGRTAAIWAGLPTSAAGKTVNRYCGSGLQAIADACAYVERYGAECVVAGGVEFDLAGPDGRPPRHLLLHRREADADPAGSVDADDRHRRHRGPALQGQPRGPGRVRAAVPAAHRRRPGRGPVPGRDRPHAHQDEGGRQGHRRGVDGRLRGRARRVQPARHDARGPGQAAAGEGARQVSSPPATPPSSRTAPRRW